MLSPRWFKYKYGGLGFGCAFPNSLLIIIVNKMKEKVFVWWCGLTQKERSKVIEEAYNNEKEIY